MSSLVSGAIRRAAVEKDSTCLTYENFVSELDSGDSFTTSIIDILVKEVADRTARTSPNDRKFLSERTIRSLRHLATHSRSYPSRVPGRSHGRRAQHLTDYFTAANDLEMEDDDDFGDPVAENATTLEGARVNSDLYDAFTNTTWPNTRRITASPSPISDDWPVQLPVRSPPSSSRPWPTPASSNPTVAPANLSRQASIRRAARSRVVDFNDFTQRRRPATRDVGASRSEGAGAETVTEPRDPPSSSQTVRRFFPFPRPGRRPPPTAVTAGWAADYVEDSPDSPDEAVQFFAVEPEHAWYDNIVDVRASPNEEDTENLLRAPRLRRGGVRAPESILSRHASPITITTPPVEPAIIPPSISRRDENSLVILSTATAEEPVAYPTPGSTENENLV
ncbi:hypothetical protein CPB84DRAFT_1840983 [Gymnopilus junonius]|uniref:Uncharacterized protein n=1 Tax=Gymnopilus junonius TaxID=109634 RepID=A0A9P5P3H8_GYMJU|nr:hypothetical protein CPB84DRAFT_1840983 [Gymnopilus junonius]